MIYVVFENDLGEILIDFRGFQRVFLAGFLRGWEESLGDLL